MKGTALLDWFTFSVKGVTDPDLVISDYLRMDPALFEDHCFGNYGYLRSKSFNRIEVYYDPSEDRVGDMGVCVSMSGSGCRTFEAHTALTSVGTPFIALVQRLHVDPDVNVSRVDLAIDDKDGILDLDVIVDCVRNNQINSRIRKRDIHDGYDGADRAGMTVYIGSPKSDFRIRIYDKAKEQFERGEEGYNQHWIRLEIVMKGDNANGFLGCLANTDNLGVVASGILNDKIAFIERDDSNISRCSFCSWWVEFLESLESIKLVSKEEVRHVLEDVIEWVTRQVAPSLSLIRDARGYLAIYDILAEGLEKRSRKHEALLNDYRHAYHLSED